MRRDEDQDERQQADQVVVIHPLGPLDEKDVREAEKEEERDEPIGEPEREAAGEDGERVIVPVHTRTRPALHPLEAVELEVKGGLDVVRPDPAHVEVVERLEEHQDPEGDAHEDERRDVDWREKRSRDAPGFPSRADPLPVLHCHATVR